MRALKHIALAFILLAQTVIMAHNAVPHHHHDGHEHHRTETCCHDHGSDGNLHLCSTHSCGQCRLLEDLFNSHNQSFGQTLLPVSSVLFPDANITEYGFAPYICVALHLAARTSGLRAPPFFV